MRYDDSERFIEHLKAVQYHFGLMVQDRVLLRGDEWPLWLDDAIRKDPLYKIEFRALTRRERRYAQGKSKKV
ncbi:MAG: hypothetical protein M0P47_09245 [Bacteroidales bacterium]|jgi:hypothetical protein|nr:hypothetical protein [Bacteroidales bacterium]